MESPISISTTQNGFFGIFLTSGFLKLDKMFPCAIWFNVNREMSSTGVLVWSLQKFLRMRNNNRFFRKKRTLERKRSKKSKGQKINWNED